MPEALPLIAGFALGKTASVLIPAYAAAAFSIGSLAGALIVGQIQAKHQQRKADAAARRSAEAAMKDRAVMVRSATEPRKVIYGEVTVSGPIVFVGSRGETKDYLDIVIALATHEVTEISDIVLNDHVITGFNADGWATDERYSRGLASNAA